MVYCFVKVTIQASVNFVSPRWIQEEGERRKEQLFTDIYLTYLFLTILLGCGKQMIKKPKQICLQQMLTLLSYKEFQIVRPKMWTWQRWASLSIVPAPQTWCGWHQGLCEWWQPKSTLCWLCSYSKAIIFPRDVRWSLFGAEIINTIPAHHNSCSGNMH